MTLLPVLLLALIHGASAGLPVAPESHLALLPAATDPMMTAAAYLGTLAALVWVLRVDLARAARGLPELLRLQITSPEGFLALCLTLATLPVALAAGLLHATGAAAALRAPGLIGVVTILGAVILLLCDQRPQTRTAPGWTMKHALALGLWQLLALLPGAGRLAMLTCGARALGYARPDALRLALLISVPPTLALGLLAAAEASAAPGPVVLLAALVALVAAATARTVIALVLHLAQRVSFLPYVFYRLALGVAVLILPIT